jgi:hypothetical protein
VAAEIALYELREAFLARGMPFDAAQATLDLAAVYLDTGRGHDLRGLWEETGPLFAGRAPEQALVPLAAFGAAVHDGKITATRLGELSRELQRGRADWAMRQG